jgi:hypothetical protein
MAALGQARLFLLHRVRQNASAVRQLHPVAQTLLALAAASLVLTIAACSSNSAQERSSWASNQTSTQASNQVRSVGERSTQERSATYRTAAVRPRPGGQAHRSDRTLVAHESVQDSVHESIHELPPPDCEFKGQEPDTVDAEQWARLKLDYARHCYEQAEEADRKRLEQLASGKCGSDQAESGQAAPDTVAPATDGGVGKRQGAFTNEKPALR